MTRCIQIGRIFILVINFLYVVSTSTESSGVLLKQSPPFRPSAQPVHVVVARFREPIDHLSWLSKYPHTIYSRGDGDSVSAFPSLHVVERMENVGREAFIFLDHIVKHFDRLAEVNVFTQAVQNVRTLYTEEDFRGDVNRLAEATKNRTKDGHTDAFSETNDGFVFLVPWCESSMHPLHMKNLRKEFGEEKCKIFTEGYSNLLNFTVENPRFSGTSCFAVTRQVKATLSLIEYDFLTTFNCIFVYLHMQAVHRNPKEYYMRLARTMGKDLNPVEGHFFERAWPQVFHSRCSSERAFHCLLDPKITC